MRNAEGYADNGKRSAAFDLSGAFRFVAKWVQRESTREAKKYTRSRYYPEIASFSPHFVGTTFYASHTMMEARKRGGLIASFEARIVDPRHASNRLSDVTQSAARRRTEDRKQLTNERRCEGERLAARHCRRLRPVAGSPTSSAAVERL